MEDDMPTKTQAEQAEPQATQGAYTLCDIPVSHLVVSENNPRQHFDQQELDRLAHAMSTRGFDHPILVKPAGEDGQYEIIDGERRWRAAQQAAVEMIPALVKTRGESAGGDLLDAMLANGLGISLDVLEEALGYQTLITDAGYSRKGISEALKIPLARVRERLLILDLPEKLRHLVAAGIVPLMAVKALVALTKIHPGLPEVAVKRVLDGPRQQWDEPTTWEDVDADPVSVLIGGYQEQLADLPDDVFVAGSSYPVSLFALDEKTAEGLAALCELLPVEPEQFEVRFDRWLLEQALALNAAHRSANNMEAIIVGGDVARQLAGDYIKACLESQREHALAERENARRTDTSGQRAVEGAGGDTGTGQDAQPLSEKEIEVGKERAREEDRRLRDETIAANQRLGAALIKHLGKVKVDERVLKILTAAPLAGDLGSIAARGARLSFPGWAELSTRKNGSTKAEYPHYLQAEAKAREFLLGASTATEIAGRTLALLAAARWAKEEHAVARTHASNYTLRFTSFGERGVPWRAEAEDLLDEILIEKLPPEVADPIREAKERRAAQRAEEERRARERDTVVAEFIEKAPSLTCDERHSEIQRLRREYGFTALPPEQGRKLMELPEPGDGETPTRAPAEAAPVEEPPADDDATPEEAEAA
jgi:ParB/RepB/Spo0J family partition protein